MAIKLRKAVLSDIPRMQELYVAAINEIAMNEYSEQQRNVWKSSIENKERWENLIQHQYVPLFEEKGELIGFSSLIDNYIDFFYVHPKHKGKGIAQIMLNHIIEKANPNVSLTSDLSETAHGFFLKNGFKTIKKNHIVKNNVELHNYHVEKILGNT